jgi:signal transduction histidine kinase
MFSAELVAIFTNLLTNAVKACGKTGGIRVTARHSMASGTSIVIENTGVRVDPSKGERWFRPFASTTTRVDPTLGQGMGLGLPITRQLLSEYGAAIRFTHPHSAYSTAIEIVFPAG